MKRRVVAKPHGETLLHRFDRALESGKARFIAGEHQHAAEIDRQAQRMIRPGVDFIRQRQ